MDALCRHKEKCMIKNPNIDLIMRETKDMPYTRNMLSALLKRLAEVEKRVEMNSKYIKREKKKINIIEFLNELEKKHTSTTHLPTFTDFKLNIVIDKTSVTDYLKAQTSLTGLTNIVMKTLNKYDNDQTPIRCFSQKRSVFYIRVQNETKDKYFWVELTDTPEYERLIINIQQKLLREYEKIHNNKLNTMSTNPHTNTHTHTHKPTHKPTNITR